MKRTREAGHAQRTPCHAFLHAYSQDRSTDMSGQQGSSQLGTKVGCNIALLQSGLHVATARLQSKPRKTSDSIVSRWLVVRYFLVGLYVGLATAAGFIWFFLYSPVRSPPTCITEQQKI